MFRKRRATTSSSVKAAAPEGFAIAFSMGALTLLIIEILGILVVGLLCGMFNGL